MKYKLLNYCQRRAHAQISFSQVFSSVNLKVSSSNIIFVHYRSLFREFKIIVTLFISNILQNYFSVRLKMSWSSTLIFLWAWRRGGHGDVTGERGISRPWMWAIWTGFCVWSRAVIVPSVLTLVPPDLWPADGELSHVPLALAPPLSDRCADARPRAALPHADGPTARSRCEFAPVQPAAPEINTNNIRDV